VKFSKAKIQAKYHKIPVIRFDDQNLTSVSSLLISQLTFAKVSLKQHVKKCFEHMKISPTFGDGETDSGLDGLPSRRLPPNQILTNPAFSIQHYVEMRSGALARIPGKGPWEVGQGKEPEF
jgi:hypothetical protein